MISWNEALKERCKTLEEKIKQLQPSVDEYSRVRAELEHLRKSQQLASPKATVPSHEAKQRPRTFQDWCDEVGLNVGGDSAHRVLKRERPDVHATVPHHCNIDKRTYP